MPRLTCAHCGFEAGNAGAFYCHAADEDTHVHVLPTPYRGHTYYAIEGGLLTWEQAEAEAPLNERIAALEADNTALRSALVGEVVRLKRIEGEADVKAETDYLSGLPVARLQMEFERANKSAAPKAALTTPDSPEAANADWGVVTTA